MQNILQVKKLAVPLQPLCKKGASARRSNCEQSEQLRSRAHCDEARMAESVDALVSNTSGAIRAGSTPAPGTG